MAKSGIKREQNKFALIFLAPALLTVLIFTTIPALTTLSYSFFRWQGFQRLGFAGFENFKKLFTFPFKPVFLMALRHNTLVFIGILILQTALGLLIGYSLYRIARGQRFFRTVTFFPVIFSLVITGYMWQSLLNPFNGPVNIIISKLGIDSSNMLWLGSTKTALPTMVFINLWRWVGFPAIVFLSGLNAINSEYLEAARIDGASELTIFRKIMLPLLAPSFTIITILTFIGAFEWFDLPYVLGGSNGNPEGAADTLALMFYRLSFGSADSIANQVGVGSALGVVIFTIVGLGAAFGTKFMRSREVEM